MKCALNITVIATTARKRRVKKFRKEVVRKKIVKPKKY